jgi:hypothetical protein
MGEIVDNAPPQIDGGQGSGVMPYPALLRILISDIMSRISVPGARTLILTNTNSSSTLVQPQVSLQVLRRCPAPFLP